VDRASSAAATAARLDAVDDPGLKALLATPRKNARQHGAGELKLTINGKPIGTQRSAPT